MVGFLIGMILGSALTFAVLVIMAINEEEDAE